MSQPRVKATHGFHATMTARPGKADELLEALLSGAPTRNENCVLFLVSRSASNPNVVHVSEGWTTKEAHAENFGKDESKALMARIEQLVSDGAQYQDEIPVGGMLRVEQQVDTPLTQVEESKAVVRRYFHVLDAGRAHPVDMCTRDFKFHVAGFPTMELDACIQFAQIFFKGLPDLQHPLVELIAEGDKVAFRCRYEGTQTEDFMGARPTGAKVSFQGIGVMRVANGKVAEFWVSPDRMSMMQQVGLLPLTT